MIDEKLFKDEIKSLQKEILDIIGECKIKEQMFILEYLKDFSQVDAYKRTTDTSKLTKGSIYQSAFIMYHSVSDKIEAVADILIRKSSTEILKILDRLNTTATFDSREIYNEDGSIKNIHDMPEHITRRIEGMKVSQKTETVVDKDGNFKSSPSKTIDLKFPSRIKADEMLAKYQEMYSDKIEVKGFTSLLDLVKKKEESNDK